MSSAASAQLLGTSRPTLLAPEFSQGNSRGILVVESFRRKFCFLGRLVRRFIHDGAGELVQVGRLRFFA
jgi:hypothetical protein